MRTSDRTLLQQLGFADKDKGNEDHDLACRYLVQPEQMARLAEMFVPLEDRHAPRGWVERFSTTDEIRRRVSFEDVRAVGVAHTGRIEEPILKGNSYHVGFADAVIDCRWSWAATQVTRLRRDWQEVSSILATSGLTGPERDAEGKRLRGETVETREPVQILAESRDDCDYWPHRLGIEVKIGRTPIGDCIRQIKLYNEHRPATWVLATRYALTVPERDALKNERIHHIRLADGFDAYKAEQAAAAEAESPEF